jgi:RimJ/RimL family protein N-acetyltransferase
LYIGLLSAYCGRGLGTRLMTQAEAWARAHGLKRLALTVMTHNAAGLGLYHKLGFETEGTARRSLLVDGVFVDEYLMGKLLL